MKIVAIVILGLLLVGCAQEQNIVRSERQIVIIPDEGMFQCPTVSVFPNPTTLTDLQVARLLVQLYENNTVCRNNIDAIKNFLETARGRLESSR